VCVYIYIYIYVAREREKMVKRSRRTMRKKVKKEKY
jgi:hypothetical protein